jgi:arginine decarboxylase
VAGDTVTDVLQYVSYSRTDLVARLRRAIEKALRAQRLTLDESGHLLRIYEQGLAGYTYLGTGKDAAPGGHAEITTSATNGMAASPKPPPV